MVTHTLTSAVNYTSLSASNDDIIDVDTGGELTINTSTVDLQRLYHSGTGPKTIVENTSTTTPIIVNFGAASTTNGTDFFGSTASTLDVLEIKGQLIQIGTGTGVAGQVVTLPTSDTSANLPDLIGLWVDHGDSLRDGTGYNRCYKQVDATAYSVAVGMEYCREVFKQDTTANTVTFKTAIPSGRPIYMGNIIFALGSTSAATYVDFQRSTYVKTTMEGCHWTNNQTNGGFDWYCRGGSFTTMRHVAFQPYEDADFQYPAAVFDYHGLILGAAKKSGVTQNNFNVGGGLGGKLTNCWADNGNRRCGFWVGALDGQTHAEAITVTQFEAAGPTPSFPDGNNAAVYIQYDEGGKVYDLRVATHTQVIEAQSAAANWEVDNVKWQTGCRSDHTGNAVDQSIVYVNQGTKDCVFRGVHQQDPTVVGGAGRTGQFSVRCLGVRVVYNDFVFYPDGTVSNLLYMGGSFCKYNGWQILDGEITGRAFYGYQPGGYNEISNWTQNVVPTNTDQPRLNPGSRCDQVALLSTSTTLSFAVTGGSYDVPRYVTYDDGDAGARTSGRVAFCLTDDRTLGIRTNVLVTGTAENNLNGQFQMDTENDVVIYRHPIIYNVSAVTAYSPENDIGAGFTERFRLRRTEGTFGSWFTGSLANWQSALAALPASNLNEIEVEHELTRTGGSAGFEAYTFSTIDVTLTGDPAPFTELIDDGSPWNDQLTAYTKPGSFGELMQQIHLAALSSAAHRTT